MPEPIYICRLLLRMIALTGARSYLRIVSQCWVRCNTRWTFILGTNNLLFQHCSPLITVPSFLYPYMVRKEKCMSLMIIVNFWCDPYNTPMYKNQSWSGDILVLHIIGLRTWKVKRLYLLCTYTFYLQRTCRHPDRPSSDKLDRCTQCLVRADMKTSAHTQELLLVLHFCRKMPEKYKTKTFSGKTPTTWMLEISPPWD